MWEKYQRGQTCDVTLQTKSSFGKLQDLNKSAVWKMRGNYHRIRVLCNWFVSKVKISSLQFLSHCYIPSVKCSAEYIVCLVIFFKWRVHSHDNQELKSFYIHTWTKKKKKQQQGRVIVVNLRLIFEKVLSWRRFESLRLLECLRIYVLYWTFRK